MTIDVADLPPPSGPADAVRRGQASQWRLMWWQFRRHRMAMAGAVVLLLIFLVAAFCEPAAFAGGDFFDWFVAADGRIVLCLGDVTGHGVGPALLAAECRAYARVLLRQIPLDEAMNRLNDLMYGDLEEGRFVTFVAVPVTFASFAITWFALEAGERGGPIVLTWRAACAAVSLVLFSLLLRVYDELKDVETDLRLGRAGDPRYRDRAIVSGRRGTLGL